MDFDEVFQYIGEFGVYQVLMYLLLGFTSYYSGYQNIANTFLGPATDHWCKVDRLYQNYSFGQQKNISIPYEEADDPDSGFDSCTYFDLPYNQYTDEQLCNWDRNAETFNASTPKCDEWVFDQSMFTRTLQTEWNLVCDSSNNVALSASIYLGGILVGAPLSGVISDRFGRKWPMVIGCVLHVALGIAGAFAPNFPTFLVFRFLLSVVNAGAYLCGFVIIMEIIGLRYTTVAGCLYQQFFSIGFMALPVFSYFVRDFRMLQIVMAAPVLLSLSFIWLVPESPRWLVAKGRFDEAEVILKNIAAVNDREYPDDIDLSTAGKDPEKEVEKGSFGDLFRYPVLRKEILIIYLIWFTNSFIYYGLSLNTGTLVGSIFLNTFISGAVEIPANFLCVLTMYTVGRRPSVGCGLLAAGIACLLMISVMDNSSLGWLLTTFSMLGKFAITISFTGIYVYTAELFPTPVRHVAVGSASMCARISGLIAPYMGAPLQAVWGPLPSILFGAFGVVSGALTFLLPETLNMGMPDTIEDAKKIGKGIKVGRLAEAEKELSEKVIADGEKPATDGHVPTVSQKVPEKEDLSDSNVNYGFSNGEIPATDGHIPTISQKIPEKEDLSNGNVNYGFSNDIPEKTYL